jgi:acetylornithine deacetylase/succinyl-diaminopimelate desuccinylase-like protein
MADWRGHLEASQDRYLAELIELLRIPSVSALPEHAGDVRRASAWAAARLAAAGMEHAESG